MSGKKLPFGARFGLAALSFVLGLALFLCTLVTLLIADVRIITSENNIRQLTKLALGSPQRVHSVVSVYRGAVGVPYGAGPKMEEKGANNSTVTDGLVEFMYEGLKDFMGDQIAMTQEELEAMIDQSTVKDFIADKAAALVSDYIIGEVTTTIDGQELKELIRENQGIIEKAIGKPLPDEVVDQVVQVVESNEIIQKLEKEGLAGFIDDISSTITGGELEGLGSISDVLTLLRAATSVGKLVWGIVICVVLIAAIILANMKQLNKGLRRSGLPLMFAGFAFVVDLVVLFVPSLFEGMEMQLVRQILLMTTGANGVVFGLGLAMVIAGFVVGSVAKKNAAKAAAEPIPAPVGAPVSVEAPADTPEEAPEEKDEEVTESSNAASENESQEI